MSYAYAGKILYIDLNERKTWEDQISPEIAGKYIGSRGINAKLLWDLTKKGIDPLGPDNPLIFGVGTLTGTTAPSSGRVTVTCKSPATNLYLKTNGGGAFGLRLKFAGYDHVVVKGVSDKPVYVFIDNGKVEIKEASHLWGKDVRETDELIKTELEDDEIETAIIGQAGENLVKIAGIMFSVHHAAARGGAGTVMGSKKLKAIAVRGNGSIKLKNSNEFIKVAEEAASEIGRDPGAQGLHEFGTAGLVAGVNALNIFAAYNFKQGHIEPVEFITGQYLVKKGYLKSRIGCAGCVINCHRFSKISEGKFAGTKTGGPEYESIGALGAGCGVTDMEVVLKSCELCNIYGLDTISTGGVIQWAMECYEKGLITKKEANGLELTWGNGDAVVSLVEAVAFRNGLGDILAEGVKRASEKIGGDSWKWAVQAKGLEQSRVETRCSKGYALAFAVNMRGPDHLMTEAIAEMGLTPEARAIIKKITGDEKYATPYITDKRAEIVRWHEDVYAITDALGFCAFTSTLAYGVSPERMAKMFTYGTGIGKSEDEIMEAGRRIITIERAFNTREGATREQDVLPWRLMNETLEIDGQKYINSKEELDNMLDEYYALHEWDVETGVPKKETLLKLGMEEIAEVLF